MKNLWMLSGRGHRRRTSGRGALLRHPACGSLIYLLTYTSILPALTVSCIRAEEPAASDITEVTEPAAADTVRTFLTILPECDWGGVRKIDVLIYESGGLGLLEKHVEASGDARDYMLMREASGIPILSDFGDKMADRGMCWVITAIMNGIYFAFCALWVSVWTLLQRLLSRKKNVPDTSEAG